MKMALWVLTFPDSFGFILRISLAKSRQKALEKTGRKKLEDDWTTTLLSRLSGSILFIYIYILIPAEPGNNSLRLPCGLRDGGHWSCVAIPAQTAIKCSHQQEKSLVAFLLLEPLSCDKILQLQQHPRQSALCIISFANSRKLISKLFPSEIENTVY